MRSRESLIDGKTTLALLSFSSFLILASLFQLAYNASDSIILGHFLGEDALAASGVSAPMNYPPLKKRRFLIIFASSGDLVPCGSPSELRQG